MCKRCWPLLCLLSGGGECQGVRGLLWNRWLASWVLEVLLQRICDCFHNYFDNWLVIKHANNLCGCLLLLLLFVVMAWLSLATMFCYYYYSPYVAASVQIPP